MPADILPGEDWPIVLQMMAEGRPMDAIPLLTERDRRVDGYFTTFDNTLYVPTLTQTTAVPIIAADTLIEGFRVGPMVWLNVVVEVSGAGGTAGNPIRITLPPSLPAVSSDARTMGSFTIQDVSVPMNYVGSAFMIGGTQVGGITNANPSSLGSSGFTAALAVNDRVSFSVIYRTTLSTV